MQSLKRQTKRFGSGRRRQEREIGGNIALVFFDPDNRFEFTADRPRMDKESRVKEKEKEEEREIPQRTKKEKNSGSLEKPGFSFTTRGRGRYANHGHIFPVLFRVTFQT